MYFNELKGQPLVVGILERQLEMGEVAHAYLFSGPRGTGKKKAARALVAALNCLSEGEKPCGRCPSCLLLARDEHPDVYQPETSGQSIKIDEVKRMLEDIERTAHFDRYKVFLIPGAEKMTDQAVNSLLKILEEPPAETIFILETANSERLLPTLRSRCQELRFSPLSREVLSELAARDLPGVDPAPVLNIAEGSYSKMLRFFENEGESERRKEFLYLLAANASGDRAEVLENAEKIVALAERGEGRAFALWALELAASWYRDNLVWLLSGKKELIINRDFIAEITAREVPSEHILTMIKEIKEKMGYLIYNVNTRLLLETILLKDRQLFSGE